MKKNCYDGYVFIGTQDAVDAGIIKKSHKKMNIFELKDLEIDSFYFNLLTAEDELNPVVYFIPYTGSDASREHVINFNLNDLYRKLTDIYEVPYEGFNSIHPEKKIDLLKRFYFEQEKQYYERVRDKIISDYNEGFKNIIPFTFNSLEEINEFIEKNNISEEEIIKALYKPEERNAIEGFHYFKHEKNGKTIFKIREELIKEVNSFKDTNYKEWFKKNIDPVLKKDVKFIYQDYTESVGLKKYTKKFPISSFTEEYFKDTDGLNPYFYNFLLERLVVVTPFNRRTVGDIMQFKGSSLSKSYVESVKRNKQGVSTFHTYYTDLSVQPEGIGTYSRIAIVKDPKEIFESVMNKKKLIDYPDGSTFSLHIAQLKKHNSLGGEIGFDAGIHHKSVGTNYSEVTTFQKHNDFTITNEFIRNSKGTKYDWNEYVLRMLSSVKFIPTKVFAESMYYDGNKVVNVNLDDYITDFSQLWSKLGGAYTVVEDENGNIISNGKRYRYTTIEDKEDISNIIHKIEVDDFKKRYNELYKNIKVPTIYNVPNKYSFDVINDSVVIYDNNGNLRNLNFFYENFDYDEYQSFIDNYFSFTEDVNKLKKQAIDKAEKLSIKGKYIESISFYSAIKTGQMNVNKGDVINDKFVLSDTLRYMMFDNRTRGIQLTSEKDIEEAEATLPQQLIGATSFGGYTKDKALKIHEKLKDLITESIDNQLKDLVENKKLTEEKRYELIKYLQEFLKEAIEDRNITEITAEIMNNVDLINFDEAQISNIFVSSFNSYLTSEGIKKSLPGAQFVLKPPSQVYEVNGLVLLAEDFFEYAKRNGINPSSIKPRDLKKADFLIEGKSIMDITAGELKSLILKLNIPVRFKNILNTIDDSSNIVNLIQEGNKNVEVFLQDFLNKFAIEEYKDYWTATKGEAIAPSLWVEEFYMNKFTPLSSITKEYFYNKLSSNIKAVSHFIMFNNLSKEDAAKLLLLKYSKSFDFKDKKQILKEIEVEVNSEEDIEELAENSKNEFKDFENLKIKFAEQRLIDFKQGHTFITQRVPLQSLASVMVNEIVGFIYTEKNTIMVNNHHQVLTGGDYDVDKSTAIVKDIRMKYRNKNKTVNELIDLFISLVNDPRNLLIRELAVNVDTLSEISDMYGEKVENNNRSFKDRILAKYNNMLGKDEIGVFAVGLKTLSGITSSAYKTLFIIKNSNKEEIKKLAKQALSHNGLTDITVDTEEEVEIIKEIFKIDPTNLEYLRKAKGYDLLGQLLNLATDNAKELKLDGLNSTLNTAGIYVYATISGIDLNSVANLLNKKHIKKLLLDAESNVFRDKYPSNFTNSVIATANKMKLNKDKDVLLLIDYLKKSNELKILGKIFGINQGLKSNVYALYNFKKVIREMANGYIDNNNKYIQGRHEDMRNNNFDFVRFIDELKNFDDYIAGKTDVKGYAVRAIEHFNDIKLTFNPLWLIATNPHFRAQFEVFNISEKTYTNTSFKFRNIDNLIKQLVSKKIISSDNVDEIAFKKIERMLEIIMIDNFIQYADLPTIYNMNGEKIDIKTISGRREFIDMFNNVVISSLKNSNAFRDNYFIFNLIKDSNKDIFDNTYYFYKINESDISDTTIDVQMRNSSLKKALRKLNVNVKMSEKSFNNIYNMIRIYNLLVHKDSVNSKSFTQYFPFDDISKSKSIFYKNIASLELPSDLDKNFLLSLSLHTKLLKETKELNISKYGIDIKEDNSSNKIFYNRKTIKQLTEVIPTTQRLLRIVRDFSPEDLLVDC